MIEAAGTERAPNPDRIRVRVRDYRLGIKVEIFDEFAKPEPGKSLANGLLEEFDVTKKLSFKERRALQQKWAATLAAREGSR